MTGCRKSCQPAKQTAVTTASVRLRPIRASTPRLTATASSAAKRGSGCLRGGPASGTRLR